MEYVKAFYITLPIIWHSISIWYIKKALILNANVSNVKIEIHSFKQGNEFISSINNRIGK